MNNFAEFDWRISGTFAKLIFVIYRPKSQKLVPQKLVLQHLMSAKIYGVNTSNFVPRVEMIGQSSKHISWVHVFFYKNN